MSSFVIAAPEALAVASTGLIGIDSAIRAANAAAAVPTTGIVAAAGDEVSAAIAALFRQPRPAIPGARRANTGPARPKNT